MGQTVFEFVAASLEAATDLDRLESRGTLRIALKEAGLDAKSVEPDQMRVVVGRTLPAQLSSRGIADAEAVCTRLAAAIDDFTPDAEASRDSPEDVFRRLGGR